MIYGVELMFDIIDEILPLGQKVWDEVDQMNDIMTFDPALDAFKAMEDTGQLRCYTMRQSGTLVGFALYLIQPVLHCKGKFHAVSDVMYIEKEYRGLGATLLDLVQRDLKEEGVNWFTFIVKAGLDNGRLAEKLGCVLHEKLYQKEL